MNIDRTLILIKPDTIGDDTWFEILMLYVAHCIKERSAIVRYKILTLSDSVVREFYYEHREKEYFEDLVAHMTSGPVIALEIRGPDVITSVRELNGATNPMEAETGTIRRLYGVRNLGPKNAVHGSDSPESAVRELSLIFGGESH